MEVRSKDRVFKRRAFVCVDKMVSYGQQATVNILPIRYYHKVPQSPSRLEQTIDRAGRLDIPDCISIYSDVGNGYIEGDQLYERLTYVMGYILYAPATRYPPFQKNIKVWNRHVHP